MSRSHDTLTLEPVSTLRGAVRDDADGELSIKDSRPRISALILARDEAHNLPDCLAALEWVDEVIVVVDPSSRDETEAVARRLTPRVLVRPFVDFARQRNAALEAARGEWVFAVDADERATPELAVEVRGAIEEGTREGYRVPIRSVILGRPFSYSGTQHDLPLRLFRRERGRWIGAVHETVALDGAAGRLCNPLLHRTIPDMRTFLRKLDAYTTLEAIQFHRDGRLFRPVLDIVARPLWTFLKLYLLKRGFLDGLEGFAFCGLSAVSVAVRNWKLRELIREAESPEGAAAHSPGREPREKGETNGTASLALQSPPRAARNLQPVSGGTRGGEKHGRAVIPGAHAPGYSLPPLRGWKWSSPERLVKNAPSLESLTLTAREAFVATRFDVLNIRFKESVESNDVRLRAIEHTLGSLEGLRLLDLGCGTGRFARRFVERGAEVVGVDASGAMLARGEGFSRVRASARRLPLASESFDAVIAIEVLEHLPHINPVLDEARRVLRPGGRLLIIDKNSGSLNAKRPWLPNLAIKRLDEARGLWMYRPGEPVRERWFWPTALRRTLARHFDRVGVEFLLSDAEEPCAVFRHIPAARLFVLWKASKGGDVG